MDISFDEGSDGFSWDDLSWANFAEEIRFIKASQPPTIAPEPGVAWGRDAATMAYILFKKPNMVAVHARQMLANLHF